MKKIPMRQCLGCREMKPKNELIRVVTTKEGDVHIDPSGKANGRGAYVCPDPACLKKAAKAKAFKPDMLENLSKELESMT